MSQTLKNENGFGLVGAIIASGLLFLMAAAIGNWVVKSKDQSLQLNSASSCQSYATSVVQAIKVHDNSLVVRNWLPASDKKEDRRFSTVLPGDPFCQKGREDLCDSLDHYYYQNPSSLDQSRLFNSQNVRGAATWALSVYNKRNPQICSDKGLEFSENNLNQFVRIFPNTIPRPDWLEKASLQIQAVNLNNNARLSCNNQDVGARPGSAVGFWVRLRVWERSRDRYCQAEASIRYGTDIAPPRLTSFRLTNGEGEELKSSTQFCTCPQDSAFKDDCDRVLRRVSVQMASTEPGSLFFCRSEKPLKTGLRYCGALGVMESPDGLVKINGPTRAGLKMGELPDGEHQFFLQAADVAGNLSSSPQEALFRVKKWQCPPANTYCPGQEPDDGCGIKCPRGTKVCNPPGGGQCLGITKEECEAAVDEATHSGCCKGCCRQHKVDCWGPPCQYLGPNERGACDACMGDNNGSGTHFCKDKSRSAGIPRDCGCYNLADHRSHGFVCADGSDWCPEGITRNEVSGRRLDQNARATQCIW